MTAVEVVGSGCTCWRQQDLWKRMWGVRERGANEEPVEDTERIS